MMPYCEIRVGDALEQLRAMPDKSVQMCVTSPPYWGLRNYGVDGQMGLEATPEAFVSAMVAVFEQVRRVLKRDGICWVNMGDSYNTQTSGNPNGIGKRYGKTASNAGCDRPCRKATGMKRDSVGTLKPKDLCGMPWRLAFALQAAGWWLRQDIIWHKSNPMPESITDRCTKAHEYLFLLSKRERYLFNADAIKEKCSESTNARVSQNLAAQEGSHRANGGGKTNGPMRAVVAGSSRKIANANGSDGKRKESFEAALSLTVENRNKRSVWTVPTHSFSGAHFATFPPDLIKPCVLAGSNPGDVVLDPFFGSGTTGMVALELGRSAIGIELNPAYAEMARIRCNVTPGMRL